MRDPITIEDHQNSRMIVDPYHILDCCLEDRRRRAVIITTAERARDLKKRPVLVSAAIKSMAPKEDIIDTGFPQMMAPGCWTPPAWELKDLDVYEPTTISRTHPSGRWKRWDIAREARGRTSFWAVE